jgi:hypothetical protein
MLGAFLPQLRDFIPVGEQDLCEVLFGSAAALQTAEEFVDVVAHVAGEFYDFGVGGPLVGLGVAGVLGLGLGGVVGGHHAGFVGLLVVCSAVGFEADRTGLVLGFH